MLILTRWHTTHHRLELQSIRSTDTGQHKDASTQEKNGCHPKRKDWPMVISKINAAGVGFARCLNKLSPFITAVATAGIVWVAYWQWTDFESQIAPELRARLSVAQIWFDVAPQANKPLSGRMFVVNNGRRDARIEFAKDPSGIHASNFRIYWGKYLPATPGVSPEYQVDFRPCQESDPVESRTEKEAE
jgi:hypothetical protein